MRNLILTSLLSLTSLMGAKASPDPNFYIYLCFGQSNMEGNAQPEKMDKEYVDPRFQTLACVNFNDPVRTMGEWYTAYPPIVRQGTGLGMADYFGRTMVANLPETVKVGVVDVAIGGTKIEGFMQEEVASYIASMDKTTEGWLINYFAAYANDPYQRLVDMAKIAQQAGVIKGILLHQGESNNTQQDWPEKVKKIYDHLISDLNLDAEETPLFVGETLSQAAGGYCWGHNSVIATVPNVIPNAHVISSAGCPGQTDGLHFTAQGYRIMGQRYAKQALSLMGIEAQIDEPATPTGEWAIDQRFTSLEDIGSTPFAIVNEQDQTAIYCEGVSDKPQFISCGNYAEAFNNNNVAIQFILRDAPVSGYHYVVAVKQDGSAYNFWGTDAYLNSGNWSSFVLGLGEGTQYGQDIQDGALWEIQYVANKGFTLKNKGTGKYFKDTAKAEYDTPTYFTFCTLKAISNGISPIRYAGQSVQQKAYDLSGRQVNTDNMRPGLYIVNGKKIVIK